MSYLNFKPNSYLILKDKFIYLFKNNNFVSLSSKKIPLFICLLAFIMCIVLLFNFILTTYFALLAHIFSVFSEPSVWAGSKADREKIAQAIIQVCTHNKLLTFSSAHKNTRVCVCVWAHRRRNATHSRI